MLNLGATDGPVNQEHIKNLNKLVKEQGESLNELKGLPMLLQEIATKIGISASNAQKVIEPPRTSIFSTGLTDEESESEELDNLLKNIPSPLITGKLNTKQH